MILLFVKGKPLSSYFIRLVTWSNWSHVAIVDAKSIQEITDSTYIYDATFLNSGVRQRKIADVLSEASKWAYVEIDVPDELAVINAAKSQIGKKYDVTGVLGIALHRNWQESDKWFCSEFVEWCMVQGGLTRFIEEVRRLTPQHCWMLKTKQDSIIRTQDDITN